LSVESEKVMTKTIVQMLDQLEIVGFIKSNGTQCRFVALTIDTPVTKMRVASPFAGVRKVAHKTGIINAKYNNAVRNRIAELLGVEVKQVEYENGEVWYRHLMTVGENPKALPLVVNRTKEDGKYYLQFFPRHSTHKYVMPDGTPVTNEQLAPWLYKQSPRPAFKPAVISIDLANVRELRASGVIVQMPDFDEAEAILAQ